VKPDAKKNWIMGENISLNGSTGIRDFITPANGQQPDNMSKYVNTQQDNGGVHINSGIPNYAFYLAATSIGGNAWEKTGKIWYETLTKRLSPKSDFQAAADGTASAAGDLFGQNSNEQKAVIDSWTRVGIRPASAPSITKTVGATR